MLLQQLRPQGPSSLERFRPIPCAFVFGLCAPSAVTQQNFPGPSAGPMTSLSLFLSFRPYHDFIYGFGCVCDRARVSPSPLSSSLRPKNGQMTRFLGFPEAPFREKMLLTATKQQRQQQWRRPIDGFSSIHSCCNLPGQSFWVSSLFLSLLSLSLFPSLSSLSPSLSPLFPLSPLEPETSQQSDG